MLSPITIPNIFRYNEGDVGRYLSVYKFTDELNINDTGFHS